MAQQAFPPPALAGGERVAYALERILPGAELDTQRGSDQGERGAEAAREVAPVGGRDELRPVAVHHDDGRIRTSLMRVAQLDPAASHQRWGGVLGRALQLAGESGRGELGKRRAMAGVDTAHELAEAGAAQSGDAAHRTEGREREPAPDVGAQRGAGLARRQIPFVDGDHRSASAVEDEPQQRRILVAHSGARVEQDDRDVGVRDRFERLDDAELLDRFRDPRTPPDPRGVDQDVTPPTVLEGHLHAVAGGARRIVGKHPGFAGEPIDQGGFAGVGPPDDADSNAAVATRGRRGFVSGGHWREHRSQRGGQAADTPAVQRRDRDGLPEAERVKVGGGDDLVEPIDLVGREDHRLAVASESIRDALVRGGQAVSRIEHQHHHTGLLDRERGLIGDEPGDRISVAGQAAGIDHDGIAPLDPHVAVPPVPGQSRQIRDQSVPGTGQGVEQGGLAGVRAADERNRGQHAAGSDAGWESLAGDQKGVRAVSLPLSPRTYTAVSPVTAGVCTALPPARVRAAKRPSSMPSQWT